MALSVPSFVFEILKFSKQKAVNFLTLGNFTFMDWFVVFVFT